MINKVYDINVIFSEQSQAKPDLNIQGDFNENYKI